MLIHAFICVRASMRTHFVLGCGLKWTGLLFVLFYASISSSFLKGIQTE